MKHFYIFFAYIQVLWSFICACLFVFFFHMSFFCSLHTLNCNMGNLFEFTWQQHIFLPSEIYNTKLKPISSFFFCFFSVLLLVSFYFALLLLFLLFVNRLCTYRPHFQIEHKDRASARHFCLSRRAPKHTLSLDEVWIIICVLEIHWSFSPNVTLK